MKKTINSNVNSTIDSNFAVGKPKTIKICETDINFYENAGIELENKQFLNIYTDITMHGMKFKSLRSRAIATIDYFIQLKNGTLGAVQYYIEINSVLYVRIEMYNISDSFDHFQEIERNNVVKIFKVNEISHKLIYLKFGQRDFVTKLANRFEKT